MRQKRAGGPDLVTARELECVQTGSKGYWKYDYTIPDKCYSELTDDGTFGVIYKFLS